MKLLLDQNLSFRFLDQLSARFPGSTQTRIAGLDRASDASNRYLLALLLKEAGTIAAFIEEPETICLELP